MAIKELIAKIKKYGVRKLSRETKISEHTLYGWTNKEKRPTIRLLSRVAEYFGVEVD